MTPGKIKTSLYCRDIAPINILEKEINSGSLKIGVFAENGTGKTFISRLFRLTDKVNNFVLDDEGKSPTDKIITLGKSSGEFSFKITDKENTIVENFRINIEKGKVPTIPNTEYIYHTFNEDYVEENISSLDYDKESEIEGYILGKSNIDLRDEEKKLESIKKEEEQLRLKIENEIRDHVSSRIDQIKNIKRLKEYNLLTPQNIFGGVSKPKDSISKSFEELIADYDKVKSVPEQLSDINAIPELELDGELFNLIQKKSAKKYSLSSLAEAFKNKIKSKQLFIETGMNLLEKSANQNTCPFCEQKIENGAVHLIEKYNEYINDTEAKTIKDFGNQKKKLEELIADIKRIEHNSTNSINKFNSYKSKYIPSSETIELKELDSIKIIDKIEQLIEKIDLKLVDISKEVIISDDLIESILHEQKNINSLTVYNNKHINDINIKKNKIGEESKRIRRNILKRTYNNLVEKYKNDINKAFDLSKSRKQLDEEINKKKEQQKVSKRSKVASTIKTVLNYFFAEKYTLDENTFRLIFKKNTLEKKQAKDILSAGEKNIVAFAYFIGDTHLKIDREDDYSKLFFIIDDPISSMDFTHVYTLCGVIRDISKVIDKLARERIFIFTHNNDFMRVLSSNNIIDKKLLLKDGKLVEFNVNSTVPYINHLIDIYNIAHRKLSPNHTTANSIRHIIETLTKFEKINISSNSIAEYILENIPNDTKSYTLINDLSHGGWRSEQAPISDEDYILA